MRITIIGGSRGTGAALAAAALAAGHEVTVLSRSGDGPAGARSITGSATDMASARSAVAGADAVVVTVGGAKGTRHHRAEVTGTVIDAMHAEGVRRILVQSSLGAGGSASQLPPLLGIVTRILLAAPLADHNAQEAAVKACGLDWTVVRPAGLTNKPATGRWRALDTTSAGTLGSSIPREDLAQCMLGLLDDPSAVGKALGVSG